jgi:hypothetical protein
MHHWQPSHFISGGVVAFALMRNPLLFWRVELLSGLLDANRAKNFRGLDQANDVGLMLHVATEA